MEGMMPRGKSRSRAMMESDVGRQRECREGYDRQSNEGIVNTRERRGEERISAKKKST